MFDEKFVQLLQAGGPALRAELFLRLVQDLQSSREGLVKAKETSDWNGINQFSHILMSLSGTVGASNLYALAQQLNTLAALHVNSEIAVPDMTQLLRETDLLIQMITDYSAASQTQSASP